MVVRRGVQHEGVEDREVADLARDLDELIALVDERAEVCAGIDALGMVGEVARDDRDRVGGDERAAAFVGDVGPVEDGEQSLLSAIEEVAKETPVLVPTAGLD